jgi:peptidoglycan-N-acetylglucosamine deacetylase
MGFLRGISRFVTMSPPVDTNPPAYVSISVDDGHHTDQRTAALLRQYNLKGTFYVPCRNPERAVMTAAEIRDLATDFEIGGHTLNHTPLRGLPESQAWVEIYDGKKALEDLLGHSVSAFCYPQGKFSARIAILVEKAGFIGARTCMLNLHGVPTNRFMWGVSTHAYPHSATIQIRHALLERNLVGVWNFVTVYGARKAWDQHFLRSLAHVEKNGGIAHLWLHSWEIDRLGDWNTLKYVCERISQSPSLLRVTNGDLFGLGCAAPRKP